MYAYVDESGNTGNSLFDINQPTFLTAATLTRTNFDKLRKSDLTLIARKVGVEALHANVLGVARIEAIADDLLSLVKKSEAAFFLSKVEKSYVAACKVFDVYFDPYDNKAAPWHAYNVRPLRLILTFKIAHCILTEEITRVFWEGVIAPKETTTRRNFLQAAELMLVRVDHIPDARSRQIVTEALQWALENPESFSIHIRDKINRNTHSPNFVAFTNLLRGIENVSKRWDSRVDEIVHDRQSEFEKTFKNWHEVVSDRRFIGEESRYWFGEDEPYTIGRAAGSKLRIATEETSPGLQLTDVIIWLFKRILDDKEIGSRSIRLMRKVYQRCHQSDFSFAGVGQAVEENIDLIMNMPMSEEKLEAGQSLMRQFESRRRAEMQGYIEQKINGNGSS